MGSLGPAKTLAYAFGSLNSNKEGAVRSLLPFLFTVRHDFTVRLDVGLL